MQPTLPRRERPDYDQALKRLLTRAHDGVLALLAPDLTWKGERSSELPAVTRRADLVWEVERQERTRGLLHIEMQTEPDDELGERIAEYMIRLWRRDHLPVRSIVIFLRPTKQLPSSPFVILWREQPSLTCAFEVVKLWELPAERVLETPFYDLWPLASLMAGASVERAVTIAERIAAAPLSQAERGELTGLLVVIAEVRLRRREVLAALRSNPMIDELVRQSSLFELAKEEGKLEGERAMVRLFLEGRFGALQDDLIAALEAADEATLHEIGKHAATESLEQLRARLSLSSN
jgi:predicted transposase YdaD